MNENIFPYKRVALNPKYYHYKPNGTGRDLYI